ncbi:hypothetical protein D9M73_144510 [compost metagenome]
MAGKFDAGGLAVLRQIIGPGIVAVARQYDEVGSLRLRALQEARARGGVAAPIVVIERQAKFGRRNARQNIVFGARRSIGGDPAQRILRHHGCAHDRAEADDLPALALADRLRERVVEPAFLLRAHHRHRRVQPRAVAEGLQRRDRIGRLEQACDIGLLGAREQARFGAEQRGKRADLIGLPRLVRHRHPFAIGLDRGGAAGIPIAFVGLVVFGTAFPAVV